MGGHALLLCALVLTVLIRTSWLAYYPEDYESLPVDVDGYGAIGRNIAAGF